MRHKLIHKAVEDQRGAGDNDEKQNVSNVVNGMGFDN